MGPLQATLAFLHTLSSARRRYLWITDREPAPTSDSGDVLQVSTLGGANGVLDPKRLGDLRTAAAAFVARDPSAFVVLDCLECLILHNGPERVQRALADLHDDVTMRGGSLVVFVDAKITNPRLVAWLERELDPLSVDSVSVRAADLLSA